MTVGAGDAVVLGTIATLAGEPVGCGFASAPQTATGTVAVGAAAGVGCRTVRSTFGAGAAAGGASHTMPIATAPKTNATADQPSAARRLFAAAMVCRSGHRSELLSSTAPATFLMAGKPIEESVLW